MEGRKAATAGSSGGEKVGASSSRLPRSMDELRRLRMVVCTVYKMLRRRDYCVEEEWDTLGVEEFAQQLRSRPSSGGGSSGGDSDFSLRATKVGNMKRRLVVVFSRTSPFSIRSLKECVEQLKHAAASSGIIVGQGKVSSSARYAMTSLQGSLALEYFRETDLLVDITEHVLNPEFTVLTTEEKNAVMQRCCATETQIPRMALDDPIARYFGLRRGQVRAARLIISCCWWRCFCFCCCFVVITDRSRSHSAIPAHTLLSLLLHTRRCSRFCERATPRDAASATGWLCSVTIN